MTALDRLAGKGFLVLGRAGMDLYADPPGTSLEDAPAFTAALGGSSANIAAGLCRMGCDAALVTRVSDDAVGRFCLRQLDAYGVDRRFVRVTGGEARTSLAVVDTNGDATQAVLYRNGAADLGFDSGDLATLPWNGFSALITTGTVLAAEPSRSACFTAFERAHGAGLPIVLDLDYRPYSWTSEAEARDICTRAAETAQIVVGNDVEFGLLAGTPERGLDTARALLDAGAQIVVYKMGADGAVTLTPEGETRTGIFRTAALKPTGAGDAFLAGFLAALADGRAVPEAVTRGSANAALVVARVGCAPAMATPDELDSFLKDARIQPPKEEPHAHPAP